MNTCVSHIHIHRAVLAHSCKWSLWNWLWTSYYAHPLNSCKLIDYLNIGRKKKRERERNYWLLMKINKCPVHVVDFCICLSDWAAAACIHIISHINIVWEYSWRNSYKFGFACVTRARKTLEYNWIGQSKNLQWQPHKLLDEESQGRASEHRNIEHVNDTTKWRFLCVWIKMHDEHIQWLRNTPQADSKRYSWN